MNWSDIGNVFVFVCSFLAVAGWLFVIVVLIAGNLAMDWLYKMYRKAPWRQHVFFLLLGFCSSVMMWNMPPIFR